MMKLLRPLLRGANLAKRQSWLIFLFQLVILLQIVSVNNAIPYFLLFGSTPKCVSIDTTSEMVIALKYHAPDFNMPRPPRPTQNDNDQAAGQKWKLFSAEQRQQVEIMKALGHFTRRLSISILQMRDTKLGQRHWHFHHDRKGQEARQRSQAAGGAADANQEKKDDASAFKEFKEIEGPFRRQSFEIDKERGDLEFATGDYEAPIEICIHSLFASPEAPLRISLNITQFYIDEWEEIKEIIEHEAKQQQQQEQQKKDDGKKDDEKKDDTKSPKDAKEEAAQQAEAKIHLTRMQSEIVAIRRKINMISNYAESHKRDSHEHQEESQAMNRASKMWPMIHVIILLITATIQTRMMLAFFKKRNLGY